MNLKAILINKTPHPIIFMDEKNNVIKTLPRSLKPIRIESDAIKTNFCLDSIPITKVNYSEDLLPIREEGVWYIVSPLVKTLYKWRTDLLVPSEIIKDDTGKVIGCRSLGILGDNKGGSDNVDN